MAHTRTLKGDTDAEKLASAMKLIDSLERKLSAYERRAAGATTDATPRRRDTRLDALEGTVAAILRHLGLQVQENTTTHDLVLAEEGQK